MMLRLNRIANKNKQYKKLYSNLQEVIKKEIDGIKEAGTFKIERVITSPQGPHIKVQNQTGQSQLDEICLCANNYLGLSNHPKVVEESINFIKSHGAGLSSDIHKSLENQISKFYGTEDTILYASCFDANAGIFETLLNEKDAIISDALNHASIIDGIRLCKAKRFRYRNVDMGDLEAQLKEADKAGARLKLIATGKYDLNYIDGVFSMDGKIAPLKDICSLAEKYSAIVFVDDCHSTGILGAKGRGTAEHFGVQDKVHIINSTLGKALGGASGGYTTGSKEIINLLRQRSRPYLFSNSLPPPVVGAASAAIKLIDEEPQLISTLWENTLHLRSKLTKAGFEIRGDNHPITPIMIKDARKASEFAEDMSKKGIYVVGFSYPVVPKGEARIRVQMSSSIDKSTLNRAIDAFVEVGKSRQVI